MKHVTSRCFSLVELLIVLAIIAIIAAILFPVFLSARERGRRTACLSNEKQLALAVTMYCQDHDEGFPAGIEKGTSWIDATLPYFKNSRILFCPDDHPVVTTNPPGEFPISYGFNSNLSTAVWISRKRGLEIASGDAITRLIGPSSTVMFFEITNGWYIYRDVWALTDSPVGNGVDVPSPAHFFQLVAYDFPNGGRTAPGPDGIWHLPLYATGNMGGRILNAGLALGVVGGSGNSTPVYGPGTSVPRHNGGANYVACDGHAIWLRPEAVSAGDDAPAPNCNQGTSTMQPEGCSAVKPYQAAGTANPGYKITFSGR